jgi:hypothetical protein
VLENEEVYINDLGAAHVTYPHLDALFGYLLNANENEQEVNVTAAFYFYQIANSLINAVPQKLLSYIYSHKKIIDVLIEKSGICAFKNLLSRFLNIYENEEKEHINFKFLKHRFTLYRKIFMRVTKNVREINEGESEKFSAIRTHKNLTEVLAELIKEQERIVDSSYFIENILFEKANIAALLNALAERPYKHLLDFASLIFQKVFEENDKKVASKSDIPSTAMINFDQFKIESDDEDKDYESPSFSKKNKTEVENECVEENFVGMDNFHSTRGNIDLQNFASNNPLAQRTYNIRSANSEGKRDFNLIIKRNSEKSEKKSEVPFPPVRKITRFEINEDSVQIEIESKMESEHCEEKDNVRENQHTAETSNECTMNLDLELYDPEVMKVNEVVELLVIKIPTLKHKLLSGLNPEPVKQGSQRWLYCNSNKQEFENAGHFRINLLKLFVSMLKIHVFEVKHVLIRENFVNQLYKLYAAYPRNNILHINVTEILESLIAFLIDYIKYDGYTQMLEQIIKQMSQTVLEMSPENLTKQKKSSMLYLGFINKLGNLIKSKLEGYETYLPVRSTEEWLRFADYLYSANKTIDNPIFNRHKRKSSIVKSIPENFELNDIKISKIMDKKSDKGRGGDSKKAKATEIEEEELMQTNINQELLNNLIESMALDQDEQPFGSDDNLVNYGEDDVNVDINLSSPRTLQKDHKTAEEELNEQLIDIPIVEDYSNSFSDKEYWNTSKVGYDVDEILKTFKQ